MLKMSKVIDLADKLPPLDPFGENRMADHVAPFLHSHADSFERWILLRNYELKRPPLSPEDLRELRREWAK
jgi:hypothetical protein